MESAVQAQLFAKTQAGYVLTEDGARLVEHAEAAEAAMVGAAEALRGNQGLTGQIRIGAPDGCANYLLPQVLTAICDANPGLEVQIVALPRVFNLSKREADMAVAVSRPETGRVTAQKITDYQLHLAASHSYLARSGVPTGRADLRAHRLIGYIPDMIFDKELDYMAEAGLGTVPFASNSVSVQLNWLRAGAGIGVVHDFALPAAPELRRVLAKDISLVRAFWLIRHEGDRRLERLNRFASLLTAGLRAEVARLETLAGLDPIA
jgi:DNA-binding transcriptional LysR family regulator